MWEARTPDSAAACERVVAAARAALPSVAAGPERPRRRRPSAFLPGLHRRAAIVVVALLALLTATLATPPGRAALSEAADLLGQIGGTPTAKDDRGGLEPLLPPGTPGGPTVVDNGDAPDGSRYEWVAYRAREQGLGRMTCLTFAWSDAPRRRATGGCGSIGGWSPGIVTSFTSRLVRPPAADPGDRMYMMTGTLHRRAHRLRILYRHPDGSEHDLPVDLGRVEGDLLRRAGGGRRPFVTFTAFVPSEQVRDHRLDARYRLASLSLIDESNELPMPWLDRDPVVRCMRRHGGVYAPGWVRVLVYDADGRRIANLPSRTSRRGPPECRAIYERRQRRIEASNAR